MTRRRRILFVIKNLQQGGTERQILRMMASLDPQKFETALCTLSPEIHYRGVPQGEPRFSFQAKGAAAVRAVRSAIAEFQPDLVHSFRDGVNRVVWRALGSTSTGPAWLMSVRGRPILPLDLLWARFMHKRAYRVTVNSVGVQAALHRYSGVARTKMQVIANLIDESTFRAPSTEERREARQQLGLPQDAFVWVLPARMSWVKNQIGLVLSLAILKRRGALSPDVEVVLAGRQRDWLASKIVPTLARVLGVRSHLRIFGAFTDPSVLYRASDALVLPSWAEGMPNVVLESLLSAVPAVVTHQANRDDLVRHGKSGFTVRTGSPVALADAMSRLMQLPPEARHRLGESGRWALIQRFARGPVVATLSSLYETAIAANRLQRAKAANPVFSKAALATPAPEGPLQDSALNQISV
ncbi:MAG TPA: glycosyltransferase [Polyangia bacterium]|jgi:glycosyltransferase involved in cell wall biosynthesis|nr:glycosyltransferase [Polyangia bacterium]